MFNQFWLHFELIWSNFGSIWPSFSVFLRGSRFGSLFCSFLDVLWTKWGSFWGHFSTHFPFVFKCFLVSVFWNHFFSFGSRFLIIFGHFLSTCWSTARKYAFFENRHPSERFAWFLSSRRHSGGIFSLLFQTLLQTPAGECFRPRFSLILGSGFQ